MYCPDQLNNAACHLAHSSLGASSLEETISGAEAEPSVQQAKARIVAVSSLRFEQSREACRADMLNRNLRAAINRVIDMHGLDECMVRSLSKATRMPVESFDTWRLLQRSDVELMLSAAENVGDRQAAMLGEVLLSNMDRYALRLNAESKIRLLN